MTIRKPEASNIFKCGQSPHIPKILHVLKILTLKKEISFPFTYDMTQADTFFFIDIPLLILSLL